MNAARASAQTLSLGYALAKTVRSLPDFIAGVPFRLLMRLHQPEVVADQATCFNRVHHKPTPWPCEQWLQAEAALDRNPTCTHTESR